MKYIFLIGSEHQLMQVDHAIKHFKIRAEEITLLVQEVDIKKKLSEKIRETYRNSSIIGFENWRFLDVFRISKKQNLFIEICNVLKNKYEKVILFTSHYSDDSTFLFISIIKPSQIYLMDEGTASFAVVVKRKERNFILSFKLYIKSIIYDEKLKIPFSICYFTRFNLNIGLNDKKEVYHLQKKENSLDFKINQFAFLGSSAVELNILDEKDYLQYLKKVIFNHQTKELLYFKHRKESNLKLAKIESIGFKIIELDAPFEKYFDSQKDMPGILSSFYTTSVLINISENFNCVPKLEINVFSNLKLKKENLIYENILNYIKTYKNFTIIEHD